ncbi:MAG TPA: ABC transporter permease [Vicinamibacterales bacterium]|nr:ABC transporter permease [Vicinamibacterales bacterium]
MAADRWFYVLRMRLRSIVGRTRVDQELDDELALHVERTIDELVRQGVPADEARRRALAGLGSVTARIEECREARGFRWARETMRDARIACRALARRPGFTTIAVTVLALGIGSTSAMFSVVYGALLRPLPYPQANRLVVLSSIQRNWRITGVIGLIEAHYVNVSAHDQLFGSVATWTTSRSAVRTGGEATALFVEHVTPAFFSVLDVSPALGRTFVKDDGQSGRDAVAVVSDHVWREVLGGKPNVIGASIVVDGKSYAVVGVMPASFRSPQGGDVWVPWTVTVDPHNATFLPVIARLKPGISAAQAAAEVQTLAPRDPDEAESDWRSDALPLSDLLVGPTRPPLLIFSAAIGLVLLVACANAAGLFLARGAERDAELRIRAALGAGRMRLVRHLLVESCLVALAGGAAGVLLAYLAVPAVVAAGAQIGAIPRVQDIHVDGLALAFTFVVAAAVGVISGLAPALRATGDLRASAASDRTTTGRQERLRGALTVAEIALSIVLLTGAGLMIRSFVHLEHVSLGFRPDHVLTATLDLPSHYDTTTEMHAFNDDVLDRLTERVETSVAASVDSLPLGGNWRTGDFTLDDGRTVPAGLMADKPLVSGDYFRAMGIEVLRGRTFTRGDRENSPGVVIVSQSLARTLWPDEDAVGQRITMDRHEHLTVVGVVDDVQQKGLRDPKSKAIYQPYAQISDPAWLRHVTFVVRSTADAAVVAPAIRDAIRSVDADLAPPTVMAMSDVIVQQTATPRFQMSLLVAFAAMALALTIVGLYGVLAHAVSRRTREFGVRMALGAAPRHIVSLVLGRALRLTVIGVIIGTAGALLASRVLAAFLFDVTPTDPITFAAVAVLVAVTALAAAIVPVRRATHVDPTTALRAE